MCPVWAGICWLLSPGGVCLHPCDVQVCRKAHHLGKLITHGSFGMCVSVAGVNQTCTCLLICCVYCSCGCVSGNGLTGPSLACLWQEAREVASRQVVPANPSL